MASVSLPSYLFPHHADHLQTALPIISSADFLTTKDLENDDDENETPIYEQYNNLLHGNRSKSYVLSFDCSFPSDPPFL